MGKLTDDQIKWTLTLDAQGVQGQINELVGSTRQLEESNKNLKNSIKDCETEMKEAEKEMAALTKAGKENSEAFDAAQKK